MPPLEPLDQLEIDELAFSDDPLGPSSRGCCKISNGNVCGSGSLVGKRNGKSLVLSNAHVCGTRIGKSMYATFPFADNARIGCKVIMAGYSDRVMMDWAVLECDSELDLPHTKLMNEMPSGEHYTGGYPRCRGPYFQRLRTTQISHNGTVWRWQPISIGGQSGSGVHAFSDDLQYGLLTWSWGGDGAGQTVRSIWFQYANRAAVGFPKPDDLIELTQFRVPADELEEGFFQEANITTLPIWAHLDDDTPPIDPPPGGDCSEFAAAVLKRAEAMQAEASKLAELARNYKHQDDGGTDGDEDGPLFGL